MKTVEYWRWYYRDKRTNRTCMTMFQLTAEEVADYPEAERIEGTMVLREVDDSGWRRATPVQARAADNQWQR